MQKIAPSITLPSELDASGISRIQEEVEKYRNGRLVFRGKYGLIDLSEEFSYKEDGYVIYQKSKGVESKFEVIPHISSLTFDRLLYSPLI